MKLYEKSQIQCVYPNAEDQQIVNKIIHEIAGGRIEIDQSERLRKCLVKTSETTLLMELYHLWKIKFSYRVG